MIRRPPRSTLSSSSAASDVYKRQVHCLMQKTMETRGAIPWLTSPASTGDSISLILKNLVWGILTRLQECCPAKNLRGALGKWRNDRWVKIQRRDTGRWQE